MKCNIDQRGRRSRILTGAIVDLVGVGLIAAGFVSRDENMYAAGVVLMVAGSFIIFEGVRGWCVLRAMGIKTPL